MVCVRVCPGRFVSVSSRRAGGGRQKMRTRHAGGMCITCQGGGGEGKEREGRGWSIYGSRCALVNVSL